MPKDNQKNPPRPKAPATKRQLTRFEKEQRLTRLLLAAVAVIIVVILAIPIYGFWRESRKGDDPAVIVYGQTISNEQYAKVLALSQVQLYNAISYYQSIANQSSSTDLAQDSDSDLMIQMASQQVAYYEQMLDTLPDSVLDDIVTNELIRHEANVRGLSVTDEEVDQFIMEQFGTTTASDETNATAAESTPTSAETPAATTPTPTPTVSPLQQAKDQMNSFLKQLGLMSETDFRTLVIEPTLLYDKLKKVIGNEVPTTAEQVHAKHILFAKDQQQSAQDTLDKLKAGADFDTLAKELSTDTASKDSGGDLGWFTRGSMVTEFEDAAFQVQPGQLYPDLVETDYGWHIIMGLGHEQDHPLDEEQLASAQQTAFSDWLQKQQADTQNISRLLDQAGKQWAQQYISSHMSSTTD